MSHTRRTRGTAWVALAVAGLLGACGEEPPPTSVAEFMENSILLEATMVRCIQSRTEARHDLECRNAREAVDRIAAREEDARRAALEAQSDRKRQALRRAQEAAAEARRRALEEERRREEAELLGPFAPLPGDAAESAAPASGEAFSPDEAPGQAPSTGSTLEPAAEQTSADENESVTHEPSELETIRREPERRQDESGQ